MLFSKQFYSLYDAHQMMMTPLRVLAELTQITFQSPYNPLAFTGLGRSVAAGAELFERMTRRFGKPRFGLAQTVCDGMQVQVSEEIVVEKPFCGLLHFKRHVNRDDPKVLIVAPMSGHHATLLRGTVAALLPEHDVYITDWTDAKHVPLRQGKFDLEDYIGYVIDFIKAVGPDTHLIAVCQPAVPVLCAVSLLAEAEDADQPRSMTLMGGPIDIAAAKTAVTQLAQDRPLSWFRDTVVSNVPASYAGAFREVYPGFVQLSGFMQMNLDRHIGEHLRLFQHLVRGDGEHAETHRKFYDEYLSVMDITAEFYLQTVERVFQKRDLANGTFTWRGHRVKPETITRTALLTVEGELDDISAPGQTEAAHKLCSSLAPQMKKHVLQPQVGHYGIFNGRKWRENIMPVVRDFIRTHDRAHPAYIRLVSNGSAAE